MFDAKSLFEMMVQGAGDQGGKASGGRGAQDGMPDLGDLLRQFTEGGQQGGAGRAQPAGQSGGGGGNILEDLMRQFGPKDNAGGETGSRGGGTQGSNPLEDLLRQFTQEKRGDQAPSGGMRELPDVGDRQGGGGGGSGGNLGDLLGEVFGQGRDAAGKAGQNAQDTMREMLEKVGGSGANAQDMLGQLTDFISNNKVGAAAALGGLGALVFGTRTGRSIAMSAAKLGALAVVGGLAYKAYQNYSQGRPMESGSVEPEAAPAGTGFEADEVSDAAAVTYIRGMIAAAAADGRIEASEQEQMIGALSQQGLDAGAEEFLANELNNPASIDDLVNGVSNQTEALQLYTAARVAIEPDTGAEQRFLAVLADRLGIAPDLRAHVDAAARGMV
ncbi:MAG: tellurite resistance TerB family protein [Hyphomicrobiaceae bacterium]